LARGQRQVRNAQLPSVTGPDSGEEELKLYGSAAEAGQDLRGKAAGAWWQTWPAEKAAVFCLHIAQAVAIEWDTGHGLMTAHQWSPRPVADGGGSENPAALPGLLHPPGPCLSRDLGWRLWPGG
jgi:hypothetical protein